MAISFEVEEVGQRPEPVGSLNERMLKPFSDAANSVQSNSVQSVRCARLQIPRFACEIPNPTQQLSNLLDLRKESNAHLRPPPYALPTPSAALACSSTCVTIVTPEVNLGRIRKRYICLCIDSTCLICITMFNSSFVLFKCHLPQLLQNAI